MIDYEWNLSTRYSGTDVLESLLRYRGSTENVSTTSREEENQSAEQSNATLSNLCGLKLKLEAYYMHTKKTVLKMKSM